MAAGKVVVYAGGKLTKTGSNEDATVDGNLVVSGNLTVTGTNTSVNVEDINVEQAEITLNYSTGNSNSTADGAGIRIQDAVDSSTDATILWDASEDVFDFSHSVNLVSGAQFEINDASVLTATALGSGVVSSSLTTVGTIGTGTWQGTAIADAYIASASTWNAKQDALTFGIADDNAVEMDDADATSGDFAKFTANGLEGRSASEMRTDLGLVIGTNVLAEQAIGIANDNLVEIDDATVNSGEFVRFTANGIEGRSKAEFLSDLDLEIGTDVLAQQAIGIANDNLVEIDSADVTSGEYAKFTGNGLESKSFAEVKTDLDVDHLITLSGVSAASDHLGTFPGNVIPDNQNVKQALEALEQEVERSGVQNTLTATQGQFINEFFDPAEAISPGKLLYPAGNRTLGVAAHDNASKDAVVGIALDNAVANAEISFLVMGNIANVGDGDTIEFNVSKNGTATKHYYRLVAKTSGSNSTSWSGTGADSSNPYIWNIVINASGEDESNVAGHIKTAVEHSSGGLDTNFTAGSVASRDGGQAFDLVADNAGSGYNFEVTNSDWENSGQMEAQATAVGVGKVKMGIPGCTVEGFNFSSGYTVGQELYLDASGNASSTVPTGGAVIRVGYVMSTDNPTDGDVMLFSPQFIMDN